MANFFVATAVYANGETKRFEGLLWYLDGTPAVEGHKQLAELRALKASGIIVSLNVDYES